MIRNVQYLLPIFVYMGKCWSCPVFERVSRNTGASHQMFQKPCSLHSLTSTCQIRKTITCLSHSLVWLPPKYSRLLAGDYNGQSVVEVIFYSLARKTVRLPYSLQCQRSKLPFSSHLCLNVVPSWKIQLEMDLEIKLNLVWLGHNFTFITSILSCSQLLIHLLIDPAPSTWGWSSLWG